MEERRTFCNYSPAPFSVLNPIISPATLGTSVPRLPHLAVECMECAGFMPQRKPWKTITILKSRFAEPQTCLNHNLSMTKVLLAGAAGSLGFEALQLLKQNNYFVRAMSHEKGWIWLTWWFCRRNNSCGRQRAWKRRRHLQRYWYYFFCSRKKCEFVQ